MPRMYFRIIIRSNVKYAWVESVGCALDAAAVAFFDNSRVSESDHLLLRAVERYPSENSALTHFCSTCWSMDTGQLFISWSTAPVKAWPRARRNYSCRPIAGNLEPWVSCFFAVNDNDLWPFHLKIALQLRLVWVTSALRFNVVWIFRFYRATSMHSADYTVARCLSVCLSVRLSVCHTPILSLNGYTYPHSFYIFG